MVPNKAVEIKSRVIFAQTKLGKKVPMNDRLKSEVRIPADEVFHGLTSDVVCSVAFLDG